MRAQSPGAAAMDSTNREKADDALYASEPGRVGTAHHESTVDLQSLVGGAHPTYLNSEKSVSLYHLPQRSVAE